VVKNSAGRRIPHEAWKYLVIPAFIFLFIAAKQAETPLESFIHKAQIAEKDIEVSSLNLERLQRSFNETEAGIQAIKGLKPAAGIAEFINGLKLKYYLSRGNRLGFKIYRLEAGIRALKEDYFTYVSLISEEYGSQIKDCFEKKCPDLKNLCGERVKWAAAADKYGDVLKIDLSSMKLIKNYSKAAVKDVRDYLQKKIVQAEQRIYLLEEEKSIFGIMKKAGISAAPEKEKHSARIAELKKLRLNLKTELSKVK
jgi:hypothetical protein